MKYNIIIGIDLQILDLKYLNGLSLLLICLIMIFFVTGMC